MKRRLNLAAGLLHDPDILLLDEPTVGVDPQSRNAIFDNLEELKRARQGAPLHHPLHGRGRAPRRSPGRHRPRESSSPTTRWRGCTRSARARRRRPRIARVGVPRADGKELEGLMTLTPFIAIVRKDLLLFFTDRRAVMLTFAVPIAIASFIGSVTQNAGRNTERTRIAVAMADEDGSAISKAIVGRRPGRREPAGRDGDAGEMRERVRRGAAERRRGPPARIRRGRRRNLFLRPARRRSPSSTCCSIRRAPRKSAWSVRSSPSMRCRRSPAGGSRCPTPCAKKR